MALYITRSISLLLGVFFIVSIAFSQPKLTTVPFASGLTLPVGMAHAGDDRLFVLERRGVIQILDSTGTLLPTPYLDISSKVLSSSTEQGLLGLAFHPNYASNGLFYINYILNEGGKKTRVSEYKLSSTDENQADVGSERILLEVSQPFDNHNGGDLHFGPDGYLYISLGDGGSAGDPDDHAQNGLDLLGKILRIDIDNGSPYEIPYDNPFIGSSTVLDEIWSLGWRNPWRFSFDRMTGDMWVGDVGQGKVEEVSRELAGSNGGLNYGWRCLEGNQIYNSNGCGIVSDYEPPVFAYVQGNNTGESVTGGYVYRGEKLTSLQGHYVFGDYESGSFWTVIENGTGNWDATWQGKLLGTRQCSAFGENSDGELFVAAYGTGNIYQISLDTTPIDPEATGGALLMFPHPLKTHINIEFPNPSAFPYVLTLTDMQGRKVREISSITASEYVLSREHLIPGVYLLELRGKEVFKGKILVD